MILKLLPTFLLANFMTAPPEVSPSMESPQGKMLQEITIEQNLGHQVPQDLVFKDSTGKEVRLGDFYGEKPVLLSLAYYECPMLCTLVLNGMTRAMRVLNFNAGEDFTVVTISIDPGETPELAAKKKQNYLEEYGRKGAEDGWFFLTGSEENIRAVADAAGFRYQYIPESDQYAHAAGIMLTTPAGILSHYFYGVEFSAKDLKLGLVEASNNQLGSPVDKVILWCFQYDPMTGKYGFAIVSALRITGIMTLLAIFGFIGRSIYLEKKKALQPNEQKA